VKAFKYEEMGSGAELDSEIMLESVFPRSNRGRSALPSELLKRTVLIIAPISIPLVGCVMRALTPRTQRAFISEEFKASCAYDIGPVTNALVKSRLSGLRSPSRTPNPGYITWAGSRKAGMPRDDRTHADYV
jgi:hypothetical protein